MTHGKYATYTNHRCRCGPCTAAWRDYRRELNHRVGRHRPQAQYLVERYPEPPPHGTESRYKTCRCDDCREAATSARRSRRRAAA